MEELNPRTKAPPTIARTSQSQSKWGRAKPKLLSLAISGLLFVVGLWGLDDILYHQTSWMKVIVWIQIIGFPCMSLFILVSLVRDWSPQQETAVGDQIAGFVIGLIPFRTAKKLLKLIFWSLAVVLCVAFGGWAVSGAVGWFATIPSWAAVIIILLILNQR